MVVNIHDGETFFMAAKLLYMTEFCRRPRLVVVDRAPYTFLAAARMMVRGRAMSLQSDESDGFHQCFLQGWERYF